MWIIDRVGVFRLHPISGFAEDRIPLKMTVFVVAELELVS